MSEKFTILCECAQITTAHITSARAVIKLEGATLRTVPPYITAHFGMVRETWVS